MHMLHVTHLLHIVYWIKIWTPACYTGLLKKGLQKNPDFHIFGKKSSSRTSRPKKQDFHGYPKQVKKSGLLIWPIRNFAKLWSVGNRSWLVQSLTNIENLSPTFMMSEFVTKIIVDDVTG